MEIRLASFEEDTQSGVDGWIGNLPFAHRIRNISLKKYGQVSIRYSLPSGNDTEYHKLLDGRFKAMLYIFEFTDAYIVCCVDELFRCLKHKLFATQRNIDGTQGCYISIDNIAHLLINKALKEARNA